LHDTLFRGIKRSLLGGSASPVLVVPVGRMRGSRRSER
jgi:hypothetical protein